MDKRKAQEEVVADLEADEGMPIEVREQKVARDMVKVEDVEKEPGESLNAVC